MKHIYNERYFANRKPFESKRHKIMLMSRRVLKLSPKSVLDVGCGHGFLVKNLRRIGINAVGCDWVPHAGSEIKEHFVLTDARTLPFADKSFDVVVSADFFEHISEEDIDLVYAEMQRVGKKVIASICFKPDRLLPGEETDTHLTVRPKEWWLNRLPNCTIYG